MLYYFWKIYNRLKQERIFAKVINFHTMTTTNEYEGYLMADPKIQIGSLVEHVVENWTGECIGLVFDDNGNTESISVWLDNGEVVDDYLEYWDLLNIEPLPDNIIDASDRFGKKDETV